MIPVQQDVGLFRLCVQALVRHTSNAFRLIVAFTGNDSRERDRLRDEFDSAVRQTFPRPQCELALLCVQNTSFAQVCNVAACHGEAPYICLLNQDACVSPGWDEAMLAALESPQVAMVGAQTNYASGQQGNPPLRWGEPRFLIFFHVMVSRRTWDLLGEMDQVTFNSFEGGEDIDWSIRAKSRGLRLALANTFTWHIGGQTRRAQGVSADAERAGYDKVALKLHNKWGPEELVKTYAQDTYTIGICSPDDRTHVAFTQCLLRLKKPPGCRIVWQPRGLPNFGRDAIVKEALATGQDYVLFLDDDMIFQPDLFERLVSHNKVFVCAVAYARKFPHPCCVFGWQEQEPVGPVAMEGIEESGLLEIGACGFGGVLIHTSVFKAIPAPWFEFTKKFGEDIGFCRKVAAAGFKMHCDTSALMGHEGERRIVQGRSKPALMEMHEKGLE